MLAKSYRFTVRNDTGASIEAGEVVVTRRGWKFSGGDLAYEAAESTPFTNAGQITNTSYESQATPSDNSSDLYLGAEFQIAVTMTTNGGSASGTVTLYYDTATNGTFPTDGEGTPVASIFIDSATVRRRSFEIIGNA